MTTETAILQTLFVRELRTLAHELDMMPDDAAVWATMPGITNSVGTLAAHLCGNLQHYVGHVLGGTDYARNRDYEFRRRSGTRAELIADVEKTITVVSSVMPTITDAMLEQPFPEPIGGMTVNTNVFLHHLSAHLALHLGQAGYLRRVINGDSRSGDPVPIKPIAS